MLTNLYNKYIIFMNNKKGQGMVEYVLIIGVISIVAIATMLLAGDQVKATFTHIVTAITPKP